MLLQSRKKPEKKSYVPTYKEAVTIAGGICGPNLSWQLRGEKTLLITGDGPMWDMKNRPHCFEEFRDLIWEVRLDDGIQSIGAGAFQDCKYLTNVNFPDTLTSIGEDAFRNCDSLIISSLPVHLMELGDNAFLRSDGFSGCVARTLPFDLRFIGSNAFHLKNGNPYLTDVRFSPKLRSIGENAFCGCYDMHLGDRFLPNTLTNVGRNAFGGCKSIQAISLPSCLKELGDYAFAGCSALEYLNLQEVERIGEAAFDSCVSLKEVWFPASLQNICNYAFRGCTGLREVRFAGDFPFINSIYFPNPGTNTYEIGQSPEYVPFLGTGELCASFHSKRWNPGKICCIGGVRFTDNRNRWPSIIRYNWGADRILWSDLSL